MKLKQEPLKKMNKKYLHTIEDQIVKDVYSAISKCQNESQYFAGGMSTQLFLPTHLHRTSSDIDTNGIFKLSIVEFQNSIMEGLEELAEKGYKRSKTKQRHTFDINLENDEERVILQYPRKSTSSYNWLKKITERENSNAQEVNYNGDILRVIPTEDILLHKFLRSNRFMEQYNLKEPKNLELHKLQDSINNSKRDYVLNQFNLEPKDSAKALAKVRLCADFFDIAALAIYKGLDKGYFLEGMGDYNKLKDKKGEILNRLYKLNPNIFGGE